LFTSRYANGAEVARLGLVPVGITAGAPRFKLKCELAGNLYALAPSRAWFSLPIDEFEARYVEKLNEQGVERLRTLLKKIGKGKDVCLLCYECVVHGEICHRRMFADWWEAETGEKVIEIADMAPFKGAKTEPKPKVDPVVDQLTLL
jgi:uncharacterized protein YeaO (DUF488 family)